MPFDSTNADLSVIPVKTPAELKRFIALPARLNAKDPNWITPLFMERTDALTSELGAHADVIFIVVLAAALGLGWKFAQSDGLPSAAGENNPPATTQGTSSASSSSTGLLGAPVKRAVEPGKWVRTKGWGDAAMARKLIQEAIDRASRQDKGQNT